MQIALSKNAVEFALQANVAYCMPFLTSVAKRRKFINPRKLTFSAVDEFVRRLILDNAVSIV